MNMFEIGSRIRLRREQLGITQEELGEYLNVKKSTISRYESGDIKSLDVDTAAKVAKALHCDPAWLSGWEDGEMIVENDVIDDLIKVAHEEPEMNELYKRIAKIKGKDAERIIKILDAVLGHE